VQGLRDIPSVEEVRRAMSEPHVRGSASGGISLERNRDEVLAAARPLPDDEDVVIEELTESEDQLFLAAIFNS
jgi:hypothetical protein